MEWVPVHDGLLQVFDVEHGACSLLTLPQLGGGMQRILIDCGHNATTDWYPGDHLRAIGVTHLDQLVVTNYDEDHVSGYRNLLERGIHIASILRNPSVSSGTIRHLKSEDGMGEGIEALADSLSGYTPIADGALRPAFNGVAREWIWNQYPHFDDENNLSLLLHLRIRGFSFLFTGDMECAGFRNVLQTCPRFREICSEVDVLMASHHGRQNGICPEMFDGYDCSPKLVVISDDYKQYDTQETTNYYGSKTRGIAWQPRQGPPCVRKVLTTRSDGELLFSFRDNNCWVTSTKG